MSLFTLISEEEIHLAPGEKIIKAKDFSSLKKAADLLKKTKKEATEYKIAVEKECEDLKEKAKKEGYADGFEQLNELILKLDKKLKTVEEELNKKIIPVALKAAKKILAEELKLQPDRIVNIVTQALKPVIQHQYIKICVNKADKEILEKNKPKIKKMLQQVKNLVIEERDDIEPGGCIIETEGGIINAQLENQWRALEAAFKTFIK